MSLIISYLPLRSIHTASKLLPGSDHLLSSSQKNDQPILELLTHTDLQIGVFMDFAISFSGHM